MNIKDECLFKQGKLTDAAFSFEDYYEYSYAHFFDNNNNMLHKIKPFLFMSNQFTWDTALLLYENIFVHNLSVFDWQHGGNNMTVITYSPEDCQNKKLLKQLYIKDENDLETYLKNMLQELNNDNEYMKNKLTDAINCGDTSIDFKYITKHIKKSILNVYNDCILHTQ